MSMTLRALRHNRGLTAQEAAEQIGVLPTSLLAYETGQTKPIVQNRHKIASFYGVQVTDIWPVDHEEKAA